VTVFRKWSDINGINEWGVVATGTLVSLIDPWNGAIVINTVMEKDRMERNDLVLLKNELVIDGFLLLLEDVPQLAIQIAYGVGTGQFEQIAVAWYLALMSTLFHMSSQVTDFIWLLWKYREFEKACKSVSDGS
jgi:hypothetical protein